MSEKQDIVVPFNHPQAKDSLAELISAIYEVRNNIDPKSDAFRFLGFTADNANRALVSLDDTIVEVPEDEDFDVCSD